MRGVFTVAVHATSDNLLMIHGSDVGPGGSRHMAGFAGVGGIDVPRDFAVATETCANDLRMINIHRGLPTGARRMTGFANAGGINVVGYFYVAA